MAMMVKLNRNAFIHGQIIKRGCTRVAEKVNQIKYATLEWYQMARSPRTLQIVLWRNNGNILGKHRSLFHPPSAVRRRIWAGPEKNKMKKSYKNKNRTGIRVTSTKVQYSSNRYSL